MKRRRICVMASSRATYGYKRRIMRLIHESEAMQLQVVVTGMHLLPAYGSTIREIEEDGLPISAKVDMMIGGDSPAVWAKSLGVEMQGLAQVLEVLKPDILVVTGDRGEMFAAAATAAYSAISFTLAFVESLLAQKISVSTTSKLQPVKEPRDDQRYY